MADLFKQLRVTVPFDRAQANFGAMTNATNKFRIDEIYHQATVSVNEQGTEASGCNVLFMANDYVTEVLELNCNRPFIFVIHDTVLNDILFIGNTQNHKTENF